MRRAPKMAGFTLLELLVAVTVGLMLAGAVLAITVGTLDLWRRVQDNFTTAAQARVALDFLERDLQTAIVRDGGGTWLAVDINNGSAALANRGWVTVGTIKPAGSESQRYAPLAANGDTVLAEARFGLSGAWLRLITTNVEGTGSRPVAVAYQVARRPVSGPISATSRAALRYSFFRAAVSAEQTFITGSDVLAVGYGSGSVSPGATRSASTLTNPNATDVIATNVVDFGVWLYTRDAAGNLMRVFPAVASGEAAYRASSPATFPAVADVMVRLLTEEGARRVAALEQQTGVMADEWWALVEAHSKVVVRRVAVGGPGR